MLNINISAVIAVDNLRNLRFFLCPAVFEQRSGWFFRVFFFLLAIMKLNVLFWIILNTLLSALLKAAWMMAALHLGEGVFSNSNSHSYLWLAVTERLTWSCVFLDWARNPTNTHRTSVTAADQSSEFLVVRHEHWPHVVCIIYKKHFLKYFMLFWGHQTINKFETD